MQNATILLTGSSGQVGFELQRSLSVLGRIEAPDRKTFDLGCPDSLRAILDQIRPDIIVNPAAYTAVDKAETDIATAIAVNTTAPAVLAEWAAEHDALLVHFSTDYVFDGGKTGCYVEHDSCNPLSVYGRSKLGGEAAISASGCRQLIFRTSWVYGAHGNNFLKTMLRLMRERDELRVVADQFGAPTSAALLADVTAQILGHYLREGRPELFPYGLYHLAASGETSWHGYAHTINRLCKIHAYILQCMPDSIIPIPSSAYPLPAPRPSNSRLDTSKLRTTFGLQLPHWELGVTQVIALLTNR
ncbi:dTDP-4-dehydrorhamnose reductase [Chitinilyticum piscinae]|nr:dTDP-4-dehydrorhamnose reductase [Chitinilyticum piscinae]